MSTKPTKRCILCLKGSNEPYPLNNSSNRRKSSRKDDYNYRDLEEYTLESFFQFFGAYLGTSEESAKAGPIKLLISEGMRACKSCWEVMKEFCLLFQQLKIIKLLLNGKVSFLKEKMDSALKDPSGMRCLKEITKSLTKNTNETGLVNGTATADEMADNIQKFKKELIKKCCQKLHTSVPKLNSESYTGSSEDSFPSNSPESEFIVKEEPPEEEEGATYSDEAEAHLDHESFSDRNLDPDFDFDFIQKAPTFDKISELTSSQDEEFANTEFDDDDNGEIEEGNSESVSSEEEDEDNDNDEDDDDYFPSKKAERVGRRRNPININQNQIQSQDKADVEVKCPDCSKNFPASAHLKIHQLKNCPSKKKIPQKQRKTSSNSTSELNFLCKDCGKSFVRASLLRQHRVSIHVPKDSAITCRIPKCSAKFEFVEEMEEHISNLHSQQKMKECAKCGKFFLKMVNFKRHQNIHLMKEQIASGVRPPPEMKVACKECPRTFRIQRDLNRHILRFHQDPKTWKFPCEVCKNRFLSRGDLNTHMRGHTKEDPFQCSSCGVKYRYNSSLKKHISREHGGSSSGNKDKMDD